MRSFGKERAIWRFGDAKPVRRYKATRQSKIEQLEGRCVLSGLTPGLPTNPRDITVMSQNLYIGADLVPAMTALQQGDRTGAAIAVAEIWDGVHKRDFGSRAQTFAAEIATEQPALVGLQEVSQFIASNAHLEDYDPTQPITGMVQMVQAGDLLTGPEATTMSVVLVGDFNSRADGLGTPTYQQLLVGMGGLTDAWTHTQGPDPGYTWSDDPDLRGTSPLDPAATDPQRIDLILYRGDLQSVGMERVIQPTGNTDPAGPLWPSDHAGVAGTLAIHVAANGSELPWAVVNEDPLRPGETAAFVMGTSASDRVWVDQRASGDLTVTTVPTLPLTILRPSPRGRLYIATGAGNDFIAVAESVVHDAIIDAGAGNDVVFGGGGNDVIYGGAGNDWLFGGRGNDVLIGGGGRDMLFGQGGDDVLVGGETSLDVKVKALCAIMLEWNR